MAYAPRYYYDDRPADYPEDIFDSPPPQSNSLSAVNAAADISKITTTGGIYGTDIIPLVSAFNTSLDLVFVGTFDFEDLNCEEDSIVKFRQEEMLAGRQVTVSRVRLIFRNLGKVEVEATVETTQGSKSHKRFIGDDSPALFSKVMTEYFDLIVTGERPQLVLKRTGKSGPLAIIRAQMITDVEIAEQI